MEPNDLTIEVLKGIREEVRGLRVDLVDTRDTLRAEIKDMRVQFDGLGQRMTDTEVRVATELVGVANAVLQVRDLLRAQDHERRIAALEKKVS